MNVKLVAAGSAILLALSGAAAAAAKTGHAGSPPRPAQIPGVAPAEAVGTVFDAALAYLQIDRKTLVQDLKNGQSIAQIATAQGKTADGLVDAVVAAARTQLDTVVAAGKLDSAREQVLLARLRTSLGVLVTRPLPAARQTGARPQPVTLFLQPLLAFIRLHLVTLPNAPAPVRPLLPRLSNGGTSIAQIAITRAKAALDAQVAAGTLTAAQESLMLSKLQAIAAGLSGDHS